MWKYVSRRIRDTCDRANIRSSVVISSSNNVTVDRKNTTYNNSPCRWFVSRKCCNYQSGNDTKSKRWNFEEINRTWIGAITWSSALVFGWYTSQLIHLKLKNQNDDRIQLKPSKNCLLEYFGCLVNNNKKGLKPLEITAQLEKSIDKTLPTVHLVTNDHIGDKRRLNSCSTDSGTSDDNDLGEVLNSIENRLGLAAIENGQHRDGLNLLRSAANRNHAPALYNLGLCYEIGLGVDVNEKTAMEMYRSAAALHHPDALYNLGIYYGQGRGGLASDQITATRLLRLAAVQGHENAIQALKTLNIDITEPPPSKDCWAKQFSPFMKDSSILPAHSSLFVENVGISQTYNYEPIVF